MSSDVGPPMPVPPPHMRDDVSALVALSEHQLVWLRTVLSSVIIEAERQGITILQERTGFMYEVQLRLEIALRGLRET